MRDRDVRELERYLRLMEYGTDTPRVGQPKVEQASVRVRFGVGGGCVRIEAWFTGGRRFFRGEYDLEEFSARQVPRRGGEVLEPHPAP